MTRLEELDALIRAEEEVKLGHAAIRKAQPRKSAVSADSRRYYERNRTSVLAKAKARYQRKKEQA